jgi:glycosyltransferase involved in cell wall biosynthesis
MSGYPWGGSEELWSRAAIDLVARGLPIAASMPEWSPLHPRVLELQARGVELWIRPGAYPWLEHPWRRVMSRQYGLVAFEVARLIAARSPALIVLSDGAALPPIELVEMCAARGLPFVTFGHANSDSWWFPDEIAERYRRALPKALRCYFVCEANRRLAEKQIGCELANGEAVCSSFNTDFRISVPWPALDVREGLRFACVARLDPPAKGQDTLLEVLARSPWVERPWQLTLYGEGPMRNVIERLARKLGIGHRVMLAGHANIEEIWASNHVLVLPSRAEGIAMVIVQAMLCERPVVTTDVGGHSEIVEDGVTGFLADAPTAPSMGEALERFWARRSEAEAIGKVAGRSIRERVPPDPVRIFADKLQNLVSSRETAWAKPKAPPPTGSPANR